MIGDSLFRGNTLGDVSIALLYSIVGVLLGLVILGISLTTAAYTNAEFPTSNDGMYGFLMKSVQPRVPLALIGGGTVSAPAYNPQYSGASGEAPINPTQYYSRSTPFSTCAWWSRLVSQKAVDYIEAMPYTYCGTFNLYRSKTIPSFAFTVARPYALGGANITATKVCGQQSTGPSSTTRAFNISDVAPTCFTAPILWNVTDSRPYNLGTEMTYSAHESGNMTAEMLYGAPLTGEGLRIRISQNVPYVIYNLSPGATMSLNSFFRDGVPGGYTTIKLINVMASSTPPLLTPTASHMVFKTEIVAPLSGISQPVGQSQTSIVTFAVSFSPPATVTQLSDYTVLVTASGSAVSSTTMVLLPTKYYIADPRDANLPQSWVNIDSLVSSTILASPPVNAVRAFVSSTSRNGQAVITYASEAGQPLFFVPSLSMHTVGTITGARPVTTLPPPNGVNYWLSVQGITSVYVAPSGRFDVSFPLIEPPRHGMFDIYASFDANSLSRMSKIFSRDLEALYAIDIANDSFYTSIRKIFTFAQMTYAVHNFTSSLVTDLLLPPLRDHLFRVFDAMIRTNRNEIQLGYNPLLFTVATGDQQYGSSQNQVFGDNHIGQYGMLLFTFYILVAIQPDVTSTRTMRDLYKTAMVDLMRDIAQPYLTDQYIPSMRHFDFATGISWQTSSIIEATSLQVSEVTNGYYACWLVAQLFNDSKLRDFYRAILSIEIATHQAYRLAPLAPQGEASTSPIYQMISAANTLFGNLRPQEFGTGLPITYAKYGAVAYLIQGGEIVAHGVRNDHPDYRYLLDNVNPNTVADFSAITFYRPMTPLTRSVVPLTLGINLNSYQSVAFSSQFQLVGLGAAGPIVEHVVHRPEVLAYDRSTGQPMHVLSLEQNPSSFMTIEAAYSLSSYARNYVTNYTWPGANLPPDSCAIIPASDLPDYLAPVVQYNRLGVTDSNTVLWIQYITTAHGPRNP